MTKTVISSYKDEDGNIVGHNLDESLMGSVLMSLERNNAFVPNIDRVVFNTNTGKEGERPVLATVVYFKDGTKVTVKNSEMDDVKLEDRTVVLSDGSEKAVKTASRESLEMGLVYAIVKRVVCEFDKDGSVSNAGFAKFLHNTLQSAYVQDVEDFRVAEERKIYKSRVDAECKEREDKPQKTSLRDTVRNLDAAVASLTELIESVLSRKNS